MKNEKPISRRNFIEKTALLTTAAGAVAGVKKTRAQINNAAVPPPARVGVGFIGVGIRGNLLMEGTREIAGVEMVAACDVYKGHLEHVKEHFSDKIITTGDYQEILARNDIDAVVIATPDHWHKRMVLEAFQAGKHVYIEKPLTLKPEEGEELIRAAKKSKKVVQVGSQFMSMACARKAMDLISSGRLGKITMVEGQFLRNSSTGAWYYPIPPDASPETIDWKRFIGDSKQYDFDLKRFFQWRLFWDYSGGLPTDLFVHLVTAVHQLMGVEAPESVVAFGDIYHWKNYREVPDQICAMATYPEGFVLKLVASANNSHPGPALTFYGTEGTLEYSGSSMKYYFEPHRVNYRYPTGSWSRATVEKFKDIMRLDDDLNPLVNPAPEVEGPFEFGPGQGQEGATTAHLRNFYDAVRSGSEAIEPMQTGVNAVNVGHMVNISYRTGKIVRWNAKKREMEV